MGWGVIWLAASQLIGILIIALISLWYFRDYPISKPDRKIFESYKVFAFPVAAASIFGVLKQYIDKIFIGVFWAATDVGLYFGVQRIALFESDCSVEGRSTRIWKESILLPGHTPRIRCNT